MEQPIAVTRQSFDDWMVPVYAPADFILVRGEGSQVWDQQGKSYIDFAGGIAVNALACAPGGQGGAGGAGGQTVASGQWLYQRTGAAPGQKLIDATFADKVFFCNSGAEANEAALKLARKHAHDQHGAGKDQIVAFNNAFHGRTLFTVSAGGQPKYSQDFAPLPGGITHTPYNDLAAAAELINDRTCAVIVEPIQGEGGVLPAEGSFLQGLRELCDRHNALLIFDEVQTGVGRTGHLYAYMQYGVVPDVLTTAKALGGGFPIGAMLTTDALAKTLGVGTHGTTYGGNPLATAVAGAVFSIINTPEVLEGVKQRHQWFIDGLNDINRQYPIFAEIRGGGLLIGCQLTKDYAGKAKQITQLANEEGVIALIAGPDVVRFTPSLIIPEQDVKEGLARFARAVARICS